MSIALLREMFERMVVDKNAELIEHYYDPDFVMYSDGLAKHSPNSATATARSIPRQSITRSNTTSRRGWRPRTRWRGGCLSPRLADR